MDLFDHFTAKPVSYTWVIEKLFESTRDIGCMKLSSPETRLSFGAFSLALAICESGDEVVVSFATEYDNIPQFYYRISVIDKEGQKQKIKDGQGIFEYVIQLDNLNNAQYCLLPDGTLTIYCEIFEISNDPGIQRCLDNLVSLSRDNQSLLDSGELSDAIVAVGGREFKAHKLILSTRSVVFKKMFESDLEASKRSRVEITDMSVGAADDLLKFIYTGKIKDLDVHVYELYAAADKYQIDSLKSYCELYLALSLSVSTAARTLQLAELYSLDELKSKCLDYISRHSAEFKFDDWKELTTRQPGLMFQVFVGSKPK